jgi:hypothetical protein
MDMVDDRRRFERKPSSIRVEMTHPAFGLIVGFARDISDGGASVLVENYATPPIGTPVDVRFKKVGGAINDEPVRMDVMYQHGNVLGLMFARRK